MTSKKTKIYFVYRPSQYLGFIRSFDHNGRFPLILEGLVACTGRCTMMISDRALVPPSMVNRGSNIRSENRSNKSISCRAVTGPNKRIFYLLRKDIMAAILL